MDTTQGQVVQIRRGRTWRTAYVFGTIETTTTGRWVEYAFAYADGASIVLRHNARRHYISATSPDIRDAR